MAMIHRFCPPTPSWRLGLPALSRLTLATLGLLGLTGGLGAPPALAQGLTAQTAATAVAQTLAPSSSPPDLCPAPALSRLGRHRVAAGETLETIAQRYGLLSPTLRGFNPTVQGGQVRVGQDLVIPPYDGIRVRVRSGQTWVQVAQAYGRSADLLFEINGCVSTVPSEIFIPGVNGFPGVSGPTTTTPPTATRSSPLQGYPLPAPAAVVMNFGWQPAPDRDERVFNTGVALAAAADTPVLAVGSGTVAFVGTDSVYGNLIVVNHADGLQTRYANLTGTTVTVGQRVDQGATLGQVASWGEGPASYLFFEVRLNSALGWVAQNPHDLVPAMALR